jgi:hypothetical protein
LTCLALAAQPVLVTYHAASSIPISVAGLFAGAGIASPTGSIHYTIGADAAPSATIAAGKASVAIPNTQATGLYSGDVT